MKTKFLFLLTLLMLAACGQKSQSEDTATTIDDEMQAVASDVNDLFESGEKFCEGLKSVEANGKYGFQDESGNIVISPQYDNVGCFSEGLCVVCINDKYGYINHDGEMVIPAKFDDGRYFLCGLAQVAINEKYGFINKSGEFVIPAIYDDSDGFFEPGGFASVTLNGKKGLIDTKGEIVAPIKYEAVSSTLKNDQGEVFATIWDGNKEIRVFNDRTVQVFEY